jgi:glycosyltransferase involved in cell wall biosynthesis
VWLLPSARTGVEVPWPHVVVLRDFSHRQAALARGERDYLEHLLQQRARAATLVYCESTFVKYHDILATCAVKADRVRTFLPARPPDGEAGASAAGPDLAALCWKYRLGGRFVLYRAVDRPDDDHHVWLIRALKRLHASEDGAGMELVCAGSGAPSVEVRRLLNAQGLTPFVHFLGAAPGPDVRALYRHAQVTVFPWLTGGSGRQVLEAIANQSCVVCAEARAFREVLDGQPEIMLYFDPRDPEATATAIRRTLAQRERFRQWQQEAYRDTARRDWRAVAADFLALCADARTEAARPSARRRSVLPVDSKEMIADVA